MLRLAATLLCLGAAQALRTSDPSLMVLPPPRHLAASGPPLALPADLALHSAAQVHPHVAAAFARFQARHLRGPAAAGAPLAPARLALTLERPLDATLSEGTDYSYTLTISRSAGIAIAAASPYGAVYALESLGQLVEGGVLQHEAVRIEDAPSFAWRGLMIDAGRRFFPLPAVTNLLDTMLAVKLNVLHLHASDECRWGVESKLFPNLTASLSGVLGGFYTQEDVGTLVAYAGARGIRVVPEFDIPSHSRGLRPIKSNGVVFCEDVESQSQVYGDPAGSTLGVLTQLFDEMAGLFPDPVIHVGADETSALGPCTTQSTFALERQVLNHLEGALNKTAAGWEEVLFDAGAATNKTVVYAWSRHTPQEIISAGRRAVDSVSGDFYMTEPAPPYPGGWKNFWYDISSGVTPSDLGMLLGGEMSMWTDTYCYIQQCGAYGGGPQVGAPLFPPERDAEFEQSVGGMMFPRGFVGAAAFWNYNASLDSQSPDFVSSLWDLNDRIRTAGGASCPSQCHCDQLTACGMPYIPLPPPPAPAAGSTLGLMPCAFPASQQFVLTPAQTLQLASDATLCVRDPGAGLYPLSLGACDAGAARFTYNGAKQWLVVVATGDCVDVESSDQKVGSWACGSGTGAEQPNQMWAMNSTGAIVSQLYDTCITAV